MNTFGEWYNPFTWFDGSSDTADSGVSSYTGGGDLFGWNPLINPPDSAPGSGGYGIDEYTASGGVLATGEGATSTNDIFSGLSDFFSGLSQTLPGLVNTGLSTWQGVQNIINEQNALNATRDELVYLPGQRTPVVKRTTGSTVTYHPITQLYPNLAPQVQQAQQSSWVGPVLLAGVAGLGLFFILKKK